MHEGTDKVASIEPKSLSERDKAMSDIAFAQELINEAFPRQKYGKASAAAYAAYRFLKPLVEPRIERPFTERRVRSLYEGAARRVDGAELEALKAAKFQRMRDEQKELRERLSRLDVELAEISAELAGRQSRAKGHAARRAV